MLRDMPEYRAVRSFAVSRRLGNRCHRDKRDESPCYVAWVRLRAALPTAGLMWFFLIPSHSVALQIRDGTRGSWDGRELEHCTLVPAGIPESDELYSVFMGMYTRVGDAHIRMADMVSALVAAHTEREAGTYVPLEVGETVWVRYYPRAGTEWLRATGEVTSMQPDGMWVRWGGDHGPMRGSETFQTLADVHDHIVRAGSVAVVPASASEERLVGRRVRVWWPDTDELHEGEVVRWVDGVHHIAYDDGDTSDWSLYWESGAEGFVLLRR